MEGFVEISSREIRENAFELIGKRWALITAGSPAAFNTMTASWGGFGVLWERDVCFAFVRPTRHTFGFMERNSNFTLSFFTEKYREALKICGTKSGRDTDKVGLAGLKPRPTPHDSMSFAEAELVIECRKIYTQDLDPTRATFPAFENFYPQKDYHRMYVGEIISCLRRA